MAVITYHHYCIVSTPVYDDNTGRWKLSASVSWPDCDNARGVRFLTTAPELFLRFEDAEHSGLDAGKNWVDNGLKKARQVELPTHSKQKSPSRGSSV